MVLPGVMEMFVVATSTLRAVIVAVFMFLNANSLCTLLAHRRYCIHRLTAAVVYLGNVAYLLTWIPFVVYGLLNGLTLVVSSTTYCLVQNWVAHGFGVLLLGVLAVRTVELLRLRATPLQKPMTLLQSAVSLLLVCFLPQLLFCLTLSHSSHHSPNSKNLNFQFLDDVTRLQWSDNETEYRIGFLICQQELTPVTLRTYYCHFRAVVVPMATLILVCTAARCFIRRQGSQLSKKSRCSLPTVQPLSPIITEGGPSICPVECDRRLIPIDLILCSNFAWHALIHPVMIVHAIHVSDSLMVTPATFLDFGSHLVLTLSSVFAPSISLTGSRKHVGKAPFFIRLPDAEDATLSKSLKRTCEEKPLLLA